MGRDTDRSPGEYLVDESLTLTLTLTLTLILGLLDSIWLTSLQNRSTVYLQTPHSIRAEHKDVRGASWVLGGILDGCRSDTDPYTDLYTDPYTDPYLISLPGCRIVLERHKGAYQNGGATVLDCVSLAQPLLSAFLGSMIRTRIRIRIRIRN